MSDNSQSSIDFSNYSDQDLQNTLSRIDKDKFPANYAACLSEIERRKNQTGSNNPLETFNFDFDPSETIHKFSYHGNGTDLALVMIKNLFLTIITLGFYSPWARTNTRRYFWSNTSFKNDRFTYTGTGEELFKGWVKLFAIIFVASIAVGIVSFLLPVVLKPAAQFLSYPIYVYVFSLAAYSGLKYRALRTLWRQIRFDVYRTKELTREFLMIYAKGMIFSGLTFGLYFPYFVINKTNFLINKANYGGIYFSFTGKHSEYFKLCLKGFLLSIITLGIYLPWFFIERLEYKLKHTHIGQNSFKFTFNGQQIFVYSVVSFLVTILTFGLASPWVIDRFYHLIADNTYLDGTLNLAGVKNIAQSESAFGDDAAISYDVDIGF